MTQEPRIHMRHVRQANLCAPGTRTWFRARGINWSLFLDEGIDASVLIDSGDPLAARIVEAARKESANG